MNDSISRQAAIDALAKDVMGGLNYENILKELPTADVVEVVRCKDCKYNAKGDNENEFWNICTLRPRLYVPVNDEDYCSRGDKKDEGEGTVT